MSQVALLEEDKRITKMVQEYYSLLEYNPDMYNFLDDFSEDELANTLILASDISELFPLFIPKTGLFVKHPEYNYRIQRFDCWLMNLVYQWFCSQCMSHRDIGFSDYIVYNFTNIVRHLSAIKSITDGGYSTIDPKYHLTLTETHELMFTCIAVADEILNGQYNNMVTLRQSEKINNRIYKELLKRLTSPSQKYIIQLEWSKLKLLKN